jgi:hypothetical protein
MFHFAGGRRYCLMVTNVAGYDLFRFGKTRPLKKYKAIVYHGLGM